MPGDVNDSIAGIIKTFGCIKHEYIYEKYEFGSYMTLLTKNSEHKAIENSDKPGLLRVSSKYCLTVIIIVIRDNINPIF